MRCTPRGTYRGARARRWGLAVLRHREAGQLLRDRRLRQGSHEWPNKVGISGAFAEFWRRSIISTEGERLKALRQVVQEALAEDFVLSLVPAFEAHASVLLEAVRKVPSFDIVECITEPFAGLATASLLGVDATEAPQIAKDAAALGLAMGPEAREHEAYTNAACERLSRRADDLLSAPPAEGFVARMIAAATGADVTDQQDLIDLVVISIFGGVDTTRAQLAFAAHLFSQHPEQWHWLRNHPEAINQALDEVIRMRPTTTWASRQAVEDFEFGGVNIAEGTVIHILVHATGTDPTIGTFNGFNIRAERKHHFGFGGGAHHCLGHFVARTDISAALRVMLREWREIRVVGTPEFLPDSGNTSPRRLEIAPVWA